MEGAHLRLQDKQRALEGWCPLKIYRLNFSPPPPPHARRRLDIASLVCTRRTVTGDGATMTLRLPFVTPPADTWAATGCVTNSLAGLTPRAPHTGGRPRRPPGLINSLSSTANLFAVRNISRPTMLVRGTLRVYRIPQSVPQWSAPACREHPLILPVIVPMATARQTPSPVLHPERRGRARQDHGVLGPDVRGAADVDFEAGVCRKGKPERGGGTGARRHRQLWPHAGGAPWPLGVLCGGNAVGSSAAWLGCGEFFCTA